ncbi:MAG: bifunctional phosphopantothenoylcysteine decarboxylase/phosphopantothenate--cysteine ligase CoaBC [Fusobacteriaceae bacterium]|jgi:phosphopantothenoylcysteine decarboxylase/phosphopantothenate--cysteine ligase|nr:bifunctional phosphopantothenoylcysteine decarboxylase/phosphopantothenate--cysteine ligase CoaBC [Fusobacteriaceae bacterium]
MLKGKTILLGITGGIAAYKMANLTSMLIKNGATVHVIMTENATKFISPLTFETLTNNRCITDTFDRNFSYDVEHISLAKASDLLLIAPASANTIGKIANGLADNMLTTTALACTCPILIAPAMNSRMYLNQVVQKNMKTLSFLGMEVISPASGRLACGDSGIGKLPDPEVLFFHIENKIAYKKDLLGKKVLVTAGPTRESIDPVRYISNHSTGKMGYAIAEICMLRGAHVTLVTGPTAIVPPMFVDVINVVSAKEMFDAVTNISDSQDIIIKAAAVADYKPEKEAFEKIKKSDSSSVLNLARTTDILKYLGENKREGQFLCGFAMETEHLLENAKSKLNNKHLDMIVANSLREEGAGFGTTTNRVTIITPDEQEQLPLMSKKEVAEKILNTIIEITTKKL